MDSDGCVLEPGSRDSAYFATRSFADSFLKKLEAGDPEAIAQLLTNP